MARHAACAIGKPLLPIISFISRDGHQEIKPLAFLAAASPAVAPRFVVFAPLPMRNVSPSYFIVGHAAIRRVSGAACADVMSRSQHRRRLSSPPAIRLDDMRRRHLAPACRKHRHVEIGCLMRSRFDNRLAAPKQYGNKWRASTRCGAGVDFIVNNLSLSSSVSSNSPI